MKLCFSSGEQNSRLFCLNLGSRQVIMALIYWDTPVLQWSAQIVAMDYTILLKSIEFPGANQENIP